MTHYLNLKHLMKQNTMVKYEIFSHETKGMMTYITNSKTKNVTDVLRKGMGKVCT